MIQGLKFLIQGENGEDTAFNVRLRSEESNLSLDLFIDIFIRLKLLYKKIYDDNMIIKNVTSYELRKIIDNSTKPYEEINTSAVYFDLQKIRTSPDDLFDSIPEKMPEYIYEDSIITPTRTRLEFYNAVRTYIEDKDQGNIMLQEMENRYPKKVWENKVPIIGALDIIINENFDKIKPELRKTSIDLKFS